MSSWYHKMKVLLVANHFIRLIYSWLDLFWSVFQHFRIILWKTELFLFNIFQWIFWYICFQWFNLFLLFSCMYILNYFLWEIVLKQREVRNAILVAGTYHVHLSFFVLEYLTVFLMIFHKLFQISLNGLLLAALTLGINCGIKILALPQILLFAT